MPSTARFIAVLISGLGILLSTQGGLVVHSLFLLRQEHIASHHCENRFKPELKCNGKCFLKKRLAGTEHNERDRHATVVSSSVFYFLATAVSNEQVYTTHNGCTYVLIDARCSLEGHTREIDPPPRLS